MGKLFGFLIVLVVLLGAGAAGAWFYAQHAYTQPGPATADGAPRMVMIDKGAGTPAIAKKLAEAGAIESPLRFRIAVRATDSGPKLKAGEYNVPSGASLKDIVGLIVEGRVVLHSVTVAEGLTSASALKVVEASPVLTGEAPATLAEGVLLPETYMVQRGETREAVVARMIAAQKKIIDELWPTRQAGLPFDTPEQALILASVVEKETGIASERPEVAAVFVNRMRRSMRLESDPTIIYGVCRQFPDRCVDGKLVNKEGQRRPILQSELDMDTGFNTYRIDGLPPTPIANPGKDAIAAVLNPPVSDALFFVADGTGKHVFAATYAEHQANVARWRKFEAQAIADERATPASAAPAPAQALTAPKP